MTFRTLDEADLSGKRVLVRVDLNVPMENGKVTDATRIDRVAPTINEIAGKGGKVILLAHFGRPKGRDPKDSLKPVATEVSDSSKPITSILAGNTTKSAGSIPSSTAVRNSHNDIWTPPATLDAA